jgi:hypothetical protein
MSSRQLLSVLGADLARFSFPTKSDAVKAFVLSKGRNAWRGDWAQDQLGCFASLEAAHSQAERLRVQRTQCTIDEVAAALLTAAPGYLLLIHPTWGRHWRRAERRLLGAG